jgi:hypothetical protein
VMAPFHSVLMVNPLEPRMPIADARCGAAVYFRAYRRWAAAVMFLTIIRKRLHSLPQKDR